MKTTIKKLIQTLAKHDWDSQVLIDTRDGVALRDLCDITKAKKIVSVSSFTSKGKPIVTLNTNRQ